MLDISFGGAVLAGLLAFFSPCVLPMAPFYLCYTAGLSMTELRAGALAARVQRRLIAAAVAFALGVTTIFVLLGIGATALGQVFSALRQPLSALAAAVLLVFGLHVLGMIRPPSSTARRGYGAGCARPGCRGCISWASPSGSAGRPARGRR